MKKRIKPQTVLSMLLDIVLLMISETLALLVRFNFPFGDIEPYHLERWYRFLPLQIEVTLITFWLMRLYHFV